MFEVLYNSFFAKSFMLKVLFLPECSNSVIGQSSALIRRVNTTDNFTTSNSLAFDFPSNNLQVCRQNEIKVEVAAKMIASPSSNDYQTDLIPLSANFVQVVRKESSHSIPFFPQFNFFVHALYYELLSFVLLRTLDDRLGKLLLDQISVDRNSIFTR
jgi:hypothetical protein